MHVRRLLLLLTQAACIPCPGDFLSGLGCSQPAGSSCESSVGVTWPSGTCATARMDGDLMVWGTINYAGGILIIGTGASVTGNVVHFTPGALHVEEDARIHSQGLINLTADAVSIGRGTSVTGNAIHINASTLRIEAGVTLTSQVAISISAGSVSLGEGAVVTGTSVSLAADTLGVASGAALRCLQHQCKVDVLVRLAHINGTVRAGDVRISATENLTLQGHVNANGLGNPYTRRRRHPYRDWRDSSMIPFGDASFPTVFGFSIDHDSGPGGRILLEACRNMHLDGNITASATAAQGTGGCILARGQTVTGSTRIEAQGFGTSYRYSSPYSGGLVGVRGGIEAVLEISADPGGIPNAGGIGDAGPQFLQYPGTDLMCPTNLSAAPSPPAPSPCLAQVVRVESLEVMSQPLLEGGMGTVPCPHGHVGHVTLQCSRGVVAAVPSSTSCNAGCSVDRRLSASSELPEQYLQALNCSSLEHGNRLSLPCLSGSGEASLWCENGALQTDAVAGCFGTWTVSTTSSTSKTSSTSTRTTTTVSTSTLTTETVTTVTTTTVTSTTTTITTTTVTSTTITITTTTVTSTTITITTTTATTLTVTSVSSTTSSSRTLTVTSVSSTTSSSSSGDGGGSSSSNLTPRTCKESEYNQFFVGAAAGAAVFVLAGLAWILVLKRLCRLQLQCLQAGFCPQRGPPREPPPGRPPATVLPLDVKDCAEYNYTGKSGGLDIAVVSCPGGADEEIGMGVGEIFGIVRMIQLLAVSVVFVKDTFDSTFWDWWRIAVRSYAEGKKFVIVLTKQNGEIGNFQKKEVRYLATGCTGEVERPSGLISANLKDTFKLAMTYKEFIAWMRCDWRLDALGLPLPEGFQNAHVQSLPSLEILQERFQRLVPDRD